MTDEIAVVIGFESAQAFRDEQAPISHRIQRGDYSPLDVRRALAATEVVFARDVLGAGVEWETVTGLSDVATLEALRGLQRKLIGFHRSDAE